MKRAMQVSRWATVAALYSIVMCPCIGQIDVDSVPAGQDRIRTSRQWYESVRAHLREQWFQPRPYRVQRDELVGRIEDAFLEDFILYETGSSRAPSIADLRLDVRELKRMGSEDPIVGYATFIIAGSRFGPEDELERVIDALRDNEHSEQFVAEAFRVMALWFRHYEAEDKVVQYAHLAAQSWIRTIEANDFDGHFGERYLTSKLCEFVDEFPPTVVDPFLVQLESLNALDRCTFHTVAGRYHVRRAWDKRGDGWANEVTEDGWEDFREHLQTARRHLERAYGIDPTRPLAAAWMVTVAMAGYSHPEEDELDWFDRAIEAQDDFVPTYTAVLWAFRPRWGGSYDNMYDFGVRCAERGDYETTVPWYFVKALLDIAADSGSFDYWKRPGVYELGVETFRRLLDAKPSAANREIYYSQLAAFAWRCERYEDAREFLTEYGRPLRASVIRDFDVAPAQLIGECFIKTSNVAGVAEEAEAASLAGDHARAALLYRQAIEDADESSFLIQALNHHRIASSRTAEFSHIFRPLTFESDLAGWLPQGGYWQVLNDTTVRGAGDGTPLRLILDMPIDCGWVLRFKMRMDISRGKTWSGIWFYGPGESRFDWNSVRFYGGRREFGIFHEGDGMRIQSDKRAWNVDDDELEIEIECGGNGRLNVRVNGAMHMSFVYRKREGDVGKYIALGGGGAENSGYVTFRDIELAVYNKMPQLRLKRMVE